MGWVILFVIVGIFAAILDSDGGKLFVGAGVLALGLLLLKWITGFGFLITLAKICAVTMVVVAVGALLLAILD